MIADDHPPTRAGVRAALEQHGFEICAEVATAAEAVEAALRERPDVCLLDINMPGSGISAAGRITRELPSTSVVMLTVSRDDDDLFDALRAGAAGYLLKDMDPVRLPRALQGVLDGEAALPRTLAARLINEFRSRDSRRRLSFAGRADVRLTDREWEVLEAMRTGRSTSEIAAALGISAVTVRRHISEILRKLGAPDRTAALRLLEKAEGSPGRSDV